VLTLFLVSFVVFAATQALPGDTARAILGREAANVDCYGASREQLGLNVNWLGGVVTGDMGDSRVQDTPVAELLARRVANRPTTRRSCSRTRRRFHGEGDTRRERHDAVNDVKEGA